MLSEKISEESDDNNQLLNQSEPAADVDRKPFDLDDSSLPLNTIDNEIEMALVANKQANLILDAAPGDNKVA